MEKFTGSLEQLQAKVKSSGVEGDWTEIANGHQFRSIDGAKLNWFTKTGTLQYQGNKEAANKLKAALTQGSEQATPALAVSGTLSPSLPVERPKVFVVHGHDTQAREQLELVLHRLGLEPFVLANTGGGMTIIEALEQDVKPQIRARFGIVLLTPDDMGWAKADGELTRQPRARQNVVLEMGMLLAALGRPNVAILKKGHIETPSDAQGIIYLSFNDHIRGTVPKLVDRLRKAGFTLGPDAITKAAS